MALLVIRIIPNEAQSAIDFRNSLIGLEIEALDLSFDNPEDGVTFGSAAHITPDLSNPNPGLNPVPIQDADNRIAQHFVIGGALPNLSRTDFAVATAIIEIPGGDPEYQTKDIKLNITRNGGEIIHKHLYYNVPISNIGLPGSPNGYQNINAEETSIYLSIPDTGQQLQPGEAYVETPVDGTPPNYQDLSDAINTVLAADPGIPVNIEDLSEEQSQHIAQEIA